MNASQQVLGMQSIDDTGESSPPVGLGSHDHAHTAANMPQGTIDHRIEIRRVGSAARRHRHQRQPANTFGLERIDQVTDPLVPVALCKARPISERSAGHDDMREGLVGADG